MATVFDAIWTAAAARMDAAVDGLLGDTLQIKLAGESAFTPRQGFVVDPDQPLQDTPLDETLPGRVRVKIAKSIMPFPLVTHRIQHPMLGAGTFAPCGTEPQTQGRYWILDVQKAST